MMMMMMMMVMMMMITPPGSDDGHDGCDNHYNDDGGDDDDVPLHSSRGLYPCHSPQAKEHKGMCPDTPEHCGGNYNL